MFKSETYLRSSQIGPHASSAPQSETSSQAVKSRKKVVLFGAGKIGLQMIDNMLHDVAAFDPLGELVVINTRPGKVKGFLQDWRQAYGAKLYRSEQRPFTLTASEQYQDIANADLIIVTAGLWPDIALKEKLKTFDPSGRFVQSIVNADLIEKIGETISQYAPQATVFVVTNQVDMMTEVMRQKIPNQSVYGVGGLVDTKRFQTILAHILFKKGYLSNADPSHVQAHIIGFHNKDMFLLRDSLLIKGVKPDWSDNQFSTYVKDAMSATIVSGKEISSLKKDPANPAIDTGAYILPASVSTEIIKAFVSAEELLIGSFNIRLSEEDACHYGLATGSAISVPVKIGAGQVTPIRSYVVDPVETATLETAQLNLNEGMKTLANIRSMQNRSTSLMPKL